MTDPPVKGQDRTPSSLADVCVIGSGPAGALVAHKLAEDGHEVVVLEAGERFDARSRIGRMERALRPSWFGTTVWDMSGARDAYTSDGDVRYPVNLKRVKGVGGSTLHWGGRVARFSERDFEMNTRHGVAADWPIGYSDLKPYYAEAEREFGVAGAEDNPHSPPREEPYPMDAFPRSYSDSIFVDTCEALGINVHSVPNARNTVEYDGRSPCVGYGTCSPVCPSRAQYSADVHVRKAEDNGTRLIDRAVVQRLEHDESGSRITAAVYRTPDGRRHRQRARQFVLAAGAIENPRLLLLSGSDEHPNGLANSSGTVGKYLMEHPYVGIVGEIDEPTDQHQIGFGTMESYQFYETGDVPPGAIKIEFSNVAGPTPVELALDQRNPLGSASDLVNHGNVASGIDELREESRPIAWGDDLLELVKKGYGNYFAVIAEVEMLPHAQNRVTLNHDERDEFGDPVPSVTWGYFTEYEEKTIEHAYEILETIVDQIDTEVDVLWSERAEWLEGAGHNSGTTRMGSDPGTSVVDRNLRAHDLENLYIAGASTFVTLGASQPTLTIAATSLRLADYLHEAVL